MMTVFYFLLLIIGVVSSQKPRPQGQRNPLMKQELKFKQQAQQIMMVQQQKQQLQQQQQLEESEKNKYAQKLKDEETAKHFNRMQKLREEQHQEDNTWRSSSTRIKRKENAPKPPPKDLQRGKLGFQPKGGVKLKCENHPDGWYSLHRQVNVTVQSIYDHQLQPTLPFVYDPTGKKRTKPHMWVSANMTYMCTYHLQDMILSRDGAIFNAKDQLPLDWSDSTVLGGREPVYFRNPGLLEGREMSAMKYLYNVPPEESHPLVVAIRMRWDDCFNHVHFQLVPIIAAIYEFHPTVWGKVYWHASKFGAALLTLMGIPLNRIIIARKIHAEKILLPWYPNWNPLQVAPFRGVSRRTTLQMTQTLLTRSIPQEIIRRIPKVIVSIIDPTKDNSYDAILARGGDGDIDALIQSQKRLVVFLARPMHEERRVVNAQEIFAALAIALSSEYTLVVMQSTQPVNEIDEMHAVWRQYAKVLSHAKVLLGTHGKCSFFFSASF